MQMRIFHVGENGRRRKAACETPARPAFKKYANKESRTAGTGKE